ncbi:MAG: DUF7666 domain-containing protein, partial [Gemmatimonadales bacterium]
SYTHDSEAKVCSGGFHFCTNPLDVLSYYPQTGRFAEVVGDECDEGDATDSKKSARHLTIKAEISLSTLLGVGVKFILDKVDWTNAPATNTGHQSAATNTDDRSAATNTGDQSAATNTGYQSAATNTGDQSAATNTGHRSAATNTGHQSAATNTGEEGCAVSLGIEGKAKGAVGCWLTLAEWKEEKYDWHRIDVQTVLVDGKTIRADVFYVLKKGEFVEAA